MKRHNDISYNNVMQFAFAPCTANGKGSGGLEPKRKEPVTLQNRNLDLKEIENRNPGPNVYIITTCTFHA